MAINGGTKEKKKKKIKLEDSSSAFQGEGNLKTLITNEDSEKHKSEHVKKKKKKVKEGDKKLCCDASVQTAVKMEQKNIKDEANALEVVKKKKKKKMKVEADEPEVILLDDGNHLQEEKKKKVKKKGVEENLTKLMKKHDKVKKENLDQSDLRENTKKKKRKLTDDTEPEEKIDVNNGQIKKKKKKKTEKAHIEEQPKDKKKKEPLKQEILHVEEESEQKKKKKSRKKGRVHEPQVEYVKKTEQKKKKKPPTQEKPDILCSPSDDQSVVFMSVRPGNRDEVSIDQARRLALQKDVDKESQPKPTLGQWSTAQFDSTSRQEKFQRLLGGFKHGSQPIRDHSARPNMALGRTGEETLQKGLMGDFERAQNRHFNFAGRGAGLGFTATENKKFTIDTSARNSIRFDD